MRFEELGLGDNPFITSIHEQADNSLVINICAGLVEAISPEQHQKDLEAAQNPWERFQASSKAIVIDESLIFRINFADYIAYQVLNESLDGAPEGPVYNDGKFKIFNQSPYLDYVRGCALMEVAAICSDNRPPLHYGLWSLNHLVDVVSCKEPKITVLSGEGELCAASGTRASSGSRPAERGRAD